MTLKNKVFLITGGASGLGAAAAEFAVERGAKVMLADIDDPGGAAVEKALGNAVKYCHTDVTSDADSRAAVAATVAAFGRVDVLLNCAGIAPGKRIIGRDGAHDLDLFSKTISINLVGVFNMMRIAAEAMSSQAPDARGERGVIINTASIAAYDGQIGQAAYAASKAGVAGLTLPAARELARHAIRVVTIAPGIFSTPMMTGMPQEVQDALGASVPYPPRLGDPREFAKLVDQIVDNQMLNGEVIRLDGALRMGAG